MTADEKNSRRLRQYFIESSTLKTIISDGLVLRKMQTAHDFDAVTEMSTFARMIVANDRRDIPLDAKVVAVHHDWRRAAVCVTLCSEKFDEVPDGAEIPFVERGGGIEAVWESVVYKTDSELVIENGVLKGEVDQLKQLIMGYEEELTEIKKVGEDFWRNDQEPAEPMDAGWTEVMSGEQTVIDNSTTPARCEADERE